MDIRNAPIVQDTKVYAFKGVSKEAGRKRLKELETKRLISPVETGTGRRLLTFGDAERLADAL